MAESMNCPKCQAPLETREIVAGVIVHDCPSCYGVLYAESDLAVPLKLGGAKPARFDCPKCRRPMITVSAYDGNLEVDRCEGCALMWFDAGEIQVLRRLAGTDTVAGKSAKAGAAPDAKPRKTADEPAGKTPVPPEMAGAKNEDADRAPSVTLDGRVYQHYQTSVPVTTSVFGEFPWVAKVGDTARMRDFVCPPYLLSQEVTAKETVWTAGEYIEPAAVWAAFGLPGEPPAKVGVAPSQPNPWAEHLAGVWLSFFLAASACVGVFVLLSQDPGAGASVYDGTFAAATADAEKSRVSDIFEVKGRTTNLAVRIDTNLDGHWAYVSMALIDADNDRALDFGQELSYYHGVEDGESWSEGSGHETIIVPSVPAGRYYLRLEPETDSPALNYRLIVKRGVPLARLPFLAILALLIPAVFAAIRSGIFENARWTDSDHPRTTDGGDDE